jgi:inhibitor of KinA
MEVKPVGESAVLVQFENEISEQVNARVISLAARLQKKPPRGFLEAAPAYASVLVRFDPFRTDGRRLARALTKLTAEKTQEVCAGKTVEIPVCYGGEYGPDLGFVAEHAGLSAAEVVKLHSGRDYRIYMLGFLPGFPYLGGLDERLHTPRLSSPRTKIPAGSVGIGGRQTGVYPIVSPGGWQLIGRTPLRLFQPENAAGLPYAAGDSIRFVPIDEDTFYRMKREAGPVCP